MRIKIDQRSDRTGLDRPYWYTRIDATIDERASCPDAIGLMAFNMIEAVGPMLAGDFVRVLVFNHAGELCGSYRGRPERADPNLRRLASDMENGVRRGDVFSRYRPS